MSNYQKIEYRDACDELRDVYHDVQSSMGTQDLPNWLTYMGEMPHILKGSWGLLKAILVDGKLTPLLQDLIMYTVAFHRTVPYCMALHGANLIRMTDSLTFEDLQDIASGHSRGFIPQKYQVALAIAAKLATSECNLTEQDFSDLISAGFDRQEAMEVTMLVSVAVFFNTYTFAANLPIDDAIAARYNAKLTA